MPDIEVNYHFLDVGGQFEYHNGNRSAYQRLFGDYLRSEPGLGGRVLDIGCGHSLNRSYRFYADLVGQLDGVDPFQAVAPPEQLVKSITASTAVRSTSMTTPRTIDYQVTQGYSGR